MIGHGNLGAAAESVTSPKSCPANLAAVGPQGVCSHPPCPNQWPPFVAGNSPEAGLTVGLIFVSEKFGKFARRDAIIQKSKLPVEVNVNLHTPEFLTLAETANMLRVSTRTVTNLINRGVLEKVALSKRCVRIHRDSLMSALAEKCAA